MIKIEITGHSTVELADKMLGIAGSLLAADYRRIYAARQALEGKAEVAEAAPVDPTPAPKSAPAAEVTGNPLTTTEASSTPAPAASVSEDEELEVVDLPIATLDIEADVRPLILSVVEKRGKPVMEELLSRFGVVKASHIEPARLPELVALMQEALAK
jgi:hypothetical protein